jgi:hypothetical protein
MPILCAVTLRTWRSNVGLRNDIAYQAVMKGNSRLEAYKSQCTILGTYLGLCLLRSYTHILEVRKFSKTERHFEHSYRHTTGKHTADETTPSKLVSCNNIVWWGCKWPQPTFQVLGTLNEIHLRSQCQCQHMSLMDFLVSLPCCGRRVTDFWGWDVHRAQLLCPDEVDGDIWIRSTRRGLKSKFYKTTQTMVTMGIFPFKKKSPW